MSVLGQLRQLSDDDLLALSNKLTLKRARKSLDKGLSVEIEASDEELVARWSDGAECAFPATGGLAAARCSCPARKLCVHRIRTILHVRALEPDEGEEPPAEDDWTPAVYSDEELSKGRAATWRKALKALAGGLAVTRVPPRSTELPSLGLRVTFLSGRPIDESACSCGALTVCEHRIIAALAWREELPELEESEPPDAGVVRERVRGFVAELLEVGLDGLPAEAAEALLALSDRAKVARQANTARDLSGLEWSLSRYTARQAGFTPALWLWQVARAGLRVAVLDSPDRTVKAGPIRGRAARDYLQGRRLRLTGLGVRPSASRTHLTGRCFFFDHATGGVLYSVVSRPRDTDQRNFRTVTDVLRGATLWGEQSAMEVAHSTVELFRPRIAQDGRLAASETSKARPTFSRDGPASWGGPLLVRSAAAFLERWGAQRHPLLRDATDSSMPVLLDLGPQPEWPLEAALATPRFDPARQQLTVRCRLVEGGSVLLRAHHEEGRKQIVEALEGHVLWGRAPRYLFALCRPTEFGIEADPISVWLADETAPRSLGAGGRLDDGNRAFLSRDEGPAPRIVADRALDCLSGLRSQLEGLSVAGIAHLEAWRRRELEDLARDLRVLGLNTGAGLLEALLSAPRGPRSDLYLELAAWVTALRERWLLDRLAAAL